MDAILVFVPENHVHAKAGQNAIAEQNTIAEQNAMAEQNAKQRMHTLLYKSLMWQVRQPFIIVYCKSSNSNTLDPE